MHAYRRENAVIDTEAWHDISVQPNARGGGGGVGQCKEEMSLLASSLSTAAAVVVVLLYHQFLWQAE